MAGHTPGPWAVFDVSTGVGVTPVHGQADVARCDGFDTLRSRDEELANARLIAAAPEMYESLRAMRDWTKAALECKSWHWDGDQREAAELELATADAVLARVGAS